MNRHDSQTHRSMSEERASVSRRAVSEGPRPTVIFIASLGHSGSTLLDLMLNAHPDVASVGELKQLNRFALQSKVRRSRPERGPRSHRCTCGAETVWDCPFWSRVSERTMETAGSDIGTLNVEDYDDAEGFTADNAVLFEAITAVSGTRYIVDSSKQLTRLRLLMANPALDVFPIFLIRDPKGQIWSALKKTSKKQFTVPELIKIYVATNREIYALVKRGPHAIVRYEDLVRDPKETLSALMQALGLAFDPRQLDFAAQERHNVGGNRMRWSDNSALTLDERWRDNLTLPQRLAIEAGTLPGRFPLLKLSLR